MAIMITTKRHNAGRSNERIVLYSQKNILSQYIDIIRKGITNMGTLQYAILGLLNRKDMTGYDMSKEFETTLSGFWNAKHSQIYPELKTLTEQKLIKYHLEISGTVLEKKVYSITAAGREQLTKWENNFNKLKPIAKDEFRLQLFFSDCVSPKHRIELLKNRLAQHEERLQQLRERKPEFQNRTAPPQEEEEFNDYLVYLGGIMREEEKCDWLKKCISLCEDRKKKS